MKHGPNPNDPFRMWYRCPTEGWRISKDGIRSLSYGTAKQIDFAHLYPASPYRLVVDPSGAYWYEEPDL